MGFFSALWDSVKTNKVLARLGMATVIVAVTGFNFFGLPLSYFLYLFCAGASLYITGNYFHADNHVVVEVNPRTMNAPEIEISVMDNSNAHMSLLQNAAFLQKNIQITNQLKGFKTTDRFLVLMKRTLEENINDDNIKDISGGVNVEDLPPNHAYFLANQSLFRQAPPQTEGGHPPPLRRRNNN